MTRSKMTSGARTRVWRVRCRWLGARRPAARTLLPKARSRREGVGEQTIQGRIFALAKGLPIAT